MRSSGATQPTRQLPSFHSRQPLFVDPHVLDATPLALGERQSTQSLTLLQSADASPISPICKPEMAIARRTASRHIGGYARASYASGGGGAARGAAGRRRRDRRLCPCQLRAGEPCAVRGKAPL